MSLGRRALILCCALLGPAACGQSSSIAPRTPAPAVTGTSTAPPSALASPSASSTPPATSACTAPAAAPPSGTVSAAFPTAIAFDPGGRLFYAERAGTVRVWQGGRAQVFASVPTVTTERGGGYSERGLLGLAVSPTFASDGFVYAIYSDVDYAHQRLVRWRDCAGVGMDRTTLVTLPSGPDCCHKGGRLAFGSDRKLYVSLGEEHTPSAAQDTGDVRGKILRYNPDGTIPADNPFGAANPAWAFGFRNPFGLAFSSTGQLAVTSNGPSGDAGAPATGYDTAVISVARGGGYQWPLCYGYSHALATTGCGSGQHGPDWSSEAATAVPTGAAFVDPSGPSPEAGHLVFCTLNKGMLILTPGSGHSAVTSGPSNCRLDVRQAPDHSLYYSDEAHIYRIT